MTTVLHESVMQTRVKTKATRLPLTLEEAKDEVNIVDDNSRDAWLNGLIKRITKQVEDDSGRVIMRQTYEGTLDRFPCGGKDIEIREWPVASLTHLKYITGGVLTLLSSTLYTTDFMSAPARISPVYGSYWPTADCRNNAVQLEWTAGYLTPAEVPDDVKAALLLALDHAYRGCGSSANYDAMIKRIRISGYSF